MKKKRVVSKEELKFNIMQITFTICVIIAAILFCLMSQFDSIGLIIMLIIIGLLWLCLFGYILYRRLNKHYYDV